MKLRDFLLYKTKVGEVVLIRENGWQIGCTRIDNEDLFIHSLHPSMLDKEVRHFEYADRDWLVKDPLVVDI